MDQLKAYATRQLRGAGVVGADAPVWSRHGSTRWLNDANKLEEAVNYVRDGQGDALPMVRPRGWRPIGQGAGEGVNEA